MFEKQPLQPENKSHLTRRQKIGLAAAGLGLASGLGAKLLTASHGHETPTRPKAPAAAQPTSNFENPMPHENPTSIPATEPHRLVEDEGAPDKTEPAHSQVTKKKASPTPNPKKTAYVGPDEQFKILPPSPTPSESPQPTPTESPSA